MPTTNAQIRARYENGNALNDGAPYNVGTDEPDNGSATAVASDSDVHVVTPDGTNNVDLSNAEEAGRVVTVVHASGGADTPTLSFSDGDFIGTGPSNMATAGDTATVINTNGESDGWAIVSTDSQA